MTTTESQPRSWEDLPPELLLSIADDLGLIDLLSFRGVCKTWCTAASKATARVESSPGRHPWFLLYSAYSHSPSCLLLPAAGKKTKYRINLPELKGATCLASSQGWLLLLTENSIFFFCPFSRNRIDLPTLPLSLSDLPDKVAAFSSLPFSKDCTVCIPNRSKYDFGVYILSRGQNEWTKLELGYLIKDFGSLTCATYCKGKFLFRDDGNFLLKFCAKQRRGRAYLLKRRGEVPPETPREAFATKQGHSRMYRSTRWRGFINDWLGSFGNAGASVSTCGTMVMRGDKLSDVYISNETDSVKTPGGRHVLGVWIHPRFFELSEDQLRWSL